MSAVLCIAPDDPDLPRIGDQVCRDLRPDITGVVDDTANGGWIVHVAWANHPLFASGWYAPSELRVLATDYTNPSDDSPF